MQSVQDAHKKNSNTLVFPRILHRLHKYKFDICKTPTCIRKAFKTRRRARCMIAERRESRQRADRVAVAQRAQGAPAPRAPIRWPSQRAHAPRRAHTSLAACFCTIATIDDAGASLQGCTQRLDAKSRCEPSSCIAAARSERTD